MNELRSIFFWIKIIGRIETSPGPVRIARRTTAEFVVACYHDQSLIMVDAERGQVTQRVALPGKLVSVGLDPRSGLAMVGLLPSGLNVVDFDRSEVVRTIATHEGTDLMAVIRQSTTHLDQRVVCA